MNQNKPSNNKPNLGLIGAVTAAIGASICCLGPLVLVGLGFSGAWIGQLSSFTRFRPFFLFFTFIFLAFAFYKVYFQTKKKVCETDSYCASPKADKMNKIALWSVTIFISGMLVFPNIIGSLKPKPSPQVQTIITKQITLNIKGMTCAGCSATVSLSLKNIDGVKQATVTFEPPEAVIIYNPDKVTPKQLIEATTNVGYPSSIKKEGEK